MQQMWTALQDVGPNHLGLCPNQSRVGRSEWLRLRLLSQQLTAGGAWAEAQEIHTYMLQASTPPEPPVRLVMAFCGLRCRHVSCSVDR